MAPKPLDHVFVEGDGVTTQPHVSAMSALFRGAATPRQQQMAMAFILSNICGVNRPVPAGLTPYDAGYAAGLRQAGICISSMAGLVMFRPVEIEDEADHE